MSGNETGLLKVAWVDTYRAVSLRLNKHSWDGGMNITVDNLGRDTHAEIFELFSTNAKIEKTIRLLGAVAAFVT